MNELKKQKKIKKLDGKNVSNNTILWIEYLLSIAIVDYRKNSINLILAPYLINIKKISYQQSFEILLEWIEKCTLLRSIDFNSKQLVKYAINYANQKKIPPMKLETLRERNPELYLQLKKF